MRPFACPNCLRLNHFEVRVCPDCAATLGYDPAIDRFRHLADEGTTWKDRNDDPADLVVCANNNDFGICNWLTTRDAPGGMCRACRHNRTIPDLADPAVPALWGKVEEAKRRLFHTLIRLGLPLETKAEETPTAQGLAFDFLYDPAAVQGGAKKIVTGHDEGLITLDVAEADDAHRERAARHGRAVSHAARPLPPRSGAPLLVAPGGHRRAQAGGVPRAVRRRARGLWRSAGRPLQRRGAALDRGLRQRLCDEPPVGGFC
jgi:hypothetical protein